MSVAHSQQFRGRRVQIIAPCRPRHQALIFVATEPAKSVETLDLSTIVDSIGEPANQRNGPLKQIGWA
jgi:hypothetical protein